MLLEPSPPGETQGFDPAVELAEGLFDPEAVYGPFPASMKARPESLLARGERKRGISVASIFRVPRWSSWATSSDRSAAGPSPTSTAQTSSIFLASTIGALCSNPVSATRSGAGSVSPSRRKRRAMQHAGALRQQLTRSGHKVD